MNSEANRTVSGKHGEQQGVLVNPACTFVSTADHMTESGALKVNQHLQVEGFANIFAIGDCNSLDDAKTAYNASRHAGVAVGNIANSVSGKRLTAYRTGTHARSRRSLLFCPEMKVVDLNLGCQAT